MSDVPDHHKLYEQTLKGVKENQTLQPKEIGTWVYHPNEEEGRAEEAQSNTDANEAGSAGSTMDPVILDLMRQHEAVEATCQEKTAEIQVIRTDLTNLLEKYGALSVQVEQVEAIVQSQGGDISELKEDVHEIKDDVEDIQRFVETARGQMAEFSADLSMLRTLKRDLDCDAEERDNLAQLLVSLEKKVTAIEKALKGKENKRVAAPLFNRR